MCSLTRIFMSFLSFDLFAIYCSSGFHRFVFSTKYLILLTILRIRNFKIIKHLACFLFSQVFLFNQLHCKR
uniref:Uncharacterized protein n=1 Tax=Helianthus annuus TaxID=4232 RepID=A0A251TJ41_HELAN